MEIIKNNLKENEVRFTEITVKNRLGLKIVLCTYGGGIKQIYVPDADGVERLVTLAPTDYAHYIDKADYHGKTIGRTAGRLCGAEYTLCDKKYQLDKNNFGIDNLHGGTEGLNAKNFGYSVKRRSDWTDVRFTYLSPDGEGGYGGNAKISVIYRIYKNVNAFEIIYKAKGDTALLLNLTNHVYFNLSGDLRQTVEKTELYINASKYGKLNDRFIIEKKTAVGKVFDFRVAKPISKHLFDRAMQAHTGGYDHQFFLRKGGFKAEAASALCKESGIGLTVRTTYPVVTFYSNNYPTNYEVFDGIKDGKYMAFCLECQFHPDGVHQEQRRNGVLPKGKNYNEKIRFEFTAE